MWMMLLAYLGGVITIVSPCILPVLPFVFARAGQPFVRSTLPLLLSMALTFAAVATMAAIGGGWAVQANQFGRIAALLLLAVMGLMLLWPTLAERLTQPLVRLGGRLSQSATHGQGSVAASLLLGVATGLLWAPCAGPILGLVLTGAALQGASAKTTGLLLAYGLGAATSLALALLVGGRVLRAMKHTLGAGEWIRRVLGLAVLAGVASIAFGLDSGWLTRLSTARTAALEQRVVAQLRPGSAATVVQAADTAGADGLADATSAVAAPLDALAQATGWLNTPPLSAEALRGHVVLVDFWTYSCINCLRSLPYVQAWAERYKKQGLVVIGVHAPEFAFEKNPDKVRRAVSDLGVGYPVALDNDYAIWRAFGNEYWPAHYFIDAEGRIRHHHFGEGGYVESERVIQSLLAESGQKGASEPPVTIAATGIAKARDNRDLQSPETYLGSRRTQRFASPGGVRAGQRFAYALPPQLQRDEWALAGAWNIAGEQARLEAAGGRITFRFHARDLHLVMGPSVDGKPVRFCVRLDGAPPGGDHGVDTDANGCGTVETERLYQLIRQPSGVPRRDRTFEIEFDAAGVEAYAFTFG